MRSDILALLWEGSLDFDGNLNFTITPKVLEKISDLPNEFEQFIGGILSETGGFVIINLTGTIKEPKFTKKFVVGELLKKLKNMIFNKQ